MTWIFRAALILEVYCPVLRLSRSRKGNAPVTVLSCHWAVETLCCLTQSMALLGSQAQLNRRLATRFRGWRAASGRPDEMSHVFGWRAHLGHPFHPGAAECPALKLGRSRRINAPVTSLSCHWAVEILCCQPQSMALLGS